MNRFLAASGVFVLRDDDDDFASSNVRQQSLRSSDAAARGVAVSVRRPTRSALLLSLPPSVKTLTDLFLC